MVNFRRGLCLYVYYHAFGLCSWLAFSSELRVDGSLDVGKIGQKAMYIYI